MSVVDELLQFLAEATTPFHAVAAMAGRLTAGGFVELEGIDGVILEPGKGYFYTRNESSIIAFRAGQASPDQGVRFIGAHTDSPNLSVSLILLKSYMGWYSWRSMYTGEHYLTRGSIETYR